MIDLIGFIELIGITRCIEFIGLIKLIGFIGFFEFIGGSGKHGRTDGFILGPS